MMIADDAFGLLSWRLFFKPSGVVEATRDGISTRLHEAYLASQLIETRNWVRLPTRLQDLLDVALATYVADRVCRRPDRKDRIQYRPWERVLRVELSVSEPDFWNQPSVRQALQETLSFYTGDQWEFSFVGQPRRQSDRFVQEDFFDTSFSPTRAALFSGGLDSAAGACVEALERQADRFLLIGGTTGPRLQAMQAQVAAELCGRFRSRMEFFPIDFGLRNRAMRAERQDELSQRSRGFVFATLGAVTAVLAGLNSLVIYENGVGAINLPHTRSQVGVHLTRATHPLALRRLEDFFHAATGIAFTFELPFLFETKASVCARIPQAEFAKLCGKTISCDGFPQRVAGHPQCGLCTSCLLRRLSLHNAGLGAFDVPNYRTNVLAAGWSAPDEKLFPLQAMRFQAAQLSQAVFRADAWSALVIEYPELLEVAISAPEKDKNGSSPRARLLAMYQAYCSEWNNFPVQLPATRHSIQVGA